MIYIIFKDQLGALKTISWTQLMAKMRADRPVKNKPFRCLKFRRCFEKKAFCYFFQKKKKQGFLDGSQFPHLSN